MPAVFLFGCKLDPSIILLFFPQALLQGEWKVKIYCLWHQRESSEAWVQCCLIPGHRVSGRLTAHCPEGTPLQVSPTCALITNVLPPEGTEAPSCSAVKLKSEQGVGEQGWCLVFKSQDERQENFWIIKPSLMVVKLALSTFPFFFYAVWKFSERKKEPEDSNQYLMLHYYYYYFEKSMHVWAHSRRWQRTGKPGGLQSMGVTKSRIWLSGWTHTHAHFTSSFIRLYETDIKCLHLWLSLIYWKKKNRILPVTGTKLGFGETDNERSISGFPGVLRPESEKDGHMIIKQR